MKRISVAAAIAMALASVAVSPPAYAKGESAAKDYKLKLSADFSKAAQPVDAALKANTLGAVPPLLPALDAAATTPDDKYAAGMLRYSYGVKAKDNAMQTGGITMMLNSGSAAVTPADRGKLLAAGGQAAYLARDYATAQRMLSEAVAQGYTSSASVYIMIADMQIRSKQFLAALPNIGKAIDIDKASGATVPDDWYKRAFAAAYNGKAPDVGQWAAKLVNAYPTPANWRMVLEVFIDTFPERSMQLDGYRLMMATNSMPGEAAYRNYANVAWESGLPGEAKMVVDAAYSKGGVAAASSQQLREVNTLATARIAGDKASLAAGAARAKAAANGKPALGAADGYLSYGLYAEAIPLYRLALSKGGVDADQANMHLGIALAKSGDKAGAKAAFEAVKGQRAGLAQLWIVYVDKGG